MRAGLNLGMNLQASITGQLHVRFPRGIAGKARLAVPCVARSRRPAFRTAADGEPFHQLAVETDVELLRPAHALDVVLVLALQANLDRVLAVDGKRVADRHAAARSKRQILALPIVLYHVQRNLEGLDGRARGRQAGREARHLPRDRQVALEMRRRDRQRLGDVVEAAVGGLVARQERLHIEAHRIEREQIANRVVVFSTVEAMHGNRSRVRRRQRGRAIDFVLEPACDRAIRGGVGPRPSGRRHRAGAQLRDHALPGLGVRARRRDVEALER